MLNTAYGYLMELYLLRKCGFTSSFFLIVRYVGKCCNFVTPKVKKSGNILLLDEISSSLDEETERELYHRLFAVNPQKTILLITHRSVVGKLCDKVVKL